MNTPAPAGLNLLARRDVFIVVSYPTERKRDRTVGPSNELGAIWHGFYNPWHIRYNRRLSNFRHADRERQGFFEIHLITHCLERGG